MFQYDVNASPLVHLYGLPLLPGKNVDAIIAKVALCHTVVPSVKEEHQLCRPLQDMKLRLERLLCLKIFSGGFFSLGFEADHSKNAIHYV